MDTEDSAMHDAQQFFENITITHYSYLVSAAFFLRNNYA